MATCPGDLKATINTHVPPLSELVDVIYEGIKPNFSHVEVEVAKCVGMPLHSFSQGSDLQHRSIGLTSKFFGKGLRIAEVGGPGNLFPNIHKEKTFDLKEICEACESPKGGAFGPGAGPHQLIGSNCEMIADINLTSGITATKIAKIVPTKMGYELSQINSSQFSLMVNLAISQDPNEQVDVVHIKAEKRTGDLNFTDAIRQSLAKYYGTKPVSLAGVFIIKQGHAKLHVMPDFPCCNFKSEEEISSKWLRYFNMSAPLVCCSVMHSYDPGHKLRMEHTHCYSQHGDAGHYHYDTTPDVVEYEGWFAPAEKIYRFDEI